MSISTEELFMDLDRSSPVPLYYQIAKRLQEAIHTGRLQPGARIENELKIADDLGISRPTIRRAIRELVDQGLLVRRRGIGTQVVRGALKRNVEMTSLFDALSQCRAVPRPPRSLVHEAAVPSMEILEALALPAETKCAAGGCAAAAL